MRKKFKSTKLFDNFSIGIRQWKASHSHCSLLHGYGIKIKATFESVESDEEKQLDENWIVDFALFSRNGLKDWLNEMFDHTVVIEASDPQLESFKFMEELGTMKLTIVEQIGAEGFAKLVFDKFQDVFSKTEGGRVRVSKIEVWENDKNSGIYELAE